MIKEEKKMNFFHLFFILDILTFLVFGQSTTTVPYEECFLVNKLLGKSYDIDCCWGNYMKVVCENGHITGLSLHNEQLSGSIPSEIGNLSYLKYLYLYSNQFTGSIPPEIGNLTNLETLDLKNNQLSGSIPPEIGNLTNLKKLDLKMNQLSGSIPKEIGNLKKLEYLYLSENHLSGSIPKMPKNCYIDRDKESVKTYEEIKKKRIIIIFIIIGIVDLFAIIALVLYIKVFRKRKTSKTGQSEANSSSTQVLNGSEEVNQSSSSQSLNRSNDSLINIPEGEMPSRTNDIQSSTTPVVNNDIQPSTIPAVNNPINIAVTKDITDISIKNKDNALNDTTLDIRNENEKKGIINNEFNKNQGPIQSVPMPIVLPVSQVVSNDNLKLQNVVNEINGQMQEVDPPPAYNEVVNEIIHQNYTAGGTSHPSQQPVNEKLHSNVRKE